MPLDTGSVVAECERMFTHSPGGRPTVVFVSQLGTGGTSWQPVIDRLTTGAATFVYDRPGTGTAPPRPDPNPPLAYGAMAAELAVTLGEAGVEGPLLVVGHSVGSLIARLFCHQQPERVAGVVHVDGSIPRLTLYPALPVSGPSVDGDGPDATQFDRAAGEVEILNTAPPRVPAAVVTRTLGRWLGCTGDETARADRLWTAYQHQLARQLKCPLVVADDAGHQIPAEQPALVAYLIDHVVRLVRGVGSRVTPDEDSLRVAGGRMEGAPRPGYRSTEHSRAEARAMLGAARAKAAMEPTQDAR